MSNLVEILKAALEALESGDTKTAKEVLQHAIEVALTEGQP